MMLATSSSNLDPRFLIKIASYDVASIIRQALPSSSRSAGTSIWTLMYDTPPQSGALHSHPLQFNLQAALIKYTSSCVVSASKADGVVTQACITHWVEMET